MVLLSEVAAGLILPGEPASISRNSLHLRLKKLEIQPVRIRPEGSSYHVNFVTKEQADLLAEDFKRTHWKKFRAAEKKSDV